MTGTKPNNDRNKMENSTGKGWSPSSGKQNPPAAGAHKAKFINHKGDQGMPQGPGIHDSVKKPR